MWWHHQLLHRSLFGTAPGLRHHPADAAMNKVYYTA